MVDVPLLREVPVWGLVVLGLLVLMVLLQIGHWSTEGMGRWGYHGLSAPYGGARPASHASHRTDTGFPAGKWYAGASGGAGQLNNPYHGVEGFLGSNFPGPLFSQNPYMVPYSIKKIEDDLASLPENSSTNEVAVNANGNAAGSNGNENGMNSFVGSPETGLGVPGASFDSSNDHSEDNLFNATMTGQN